MSHTATRRNKAIVKGPRFLYDLVARAFPWIDSVHNEVHKGNHYSLTYSIADMGAATMPDDSITLSFITPASPILHMTIVAIGGSGARMQLIRGKTGGGASPTGVLQSYNNNENSTNVSTILDVAGANASKVSYDATIFTGGVTLIDRYIGADGIGLAFAGGDHRGDQERVLKVSTAYQLVLTDTNNVPGTLQLSWYEI